MKISLAALSLAIVSASAQTAIAPPQIGFIQDPVGSFRPVYGLAGNFIVGAPAATGVVSAAYSGSFGFVKTNPAILVTDALGHLVTSASAPSGPALFAFSATGQPALVYLPNSNSLLQWNGATLVPSPLDPAAIAANTVWSIAAPDPDHVAFLVERQDGLWDLRVLLSTGQVDSQTALPAVNPPAFMLANGQIISTGSQGLVVLEPDGSQIHIAASLPRGFSLRQIGDGWLELRNPGIPGKLGTSRGFAVRVVPNHEGFYILPEVTQ